MRALKMHVSALCDLPENEFLFVQKMKWHFAVQVCPLINCFLCYQNILRISDLISALPAVGERLFTYISKQQHTEFSAVTGKLI